jgi:HK97 family phage prohead protease
MPDKPPSQFDNQSDWMAYCVPFMMRPSGDDMPNKQAVATCLDMWRRRNKKEVADTTDRAWSVLTVKAIDSEQRTIEGMATTPEVDRVGDVVEPMGGKFALPMPLLWQHDHKSPVGHVIGAKATKDGISIKAQLAKIDEPGELKNLVDKAWQSVKAGLVRGLSIGFKPVEFEPLDVKDPFGGLRFTSWLWFELSLVTIAANAAATIAVVKSHDLSAASGQPARDARSASRPGASGKSVKLKPEEPKMKTLTEQIQALENKRAANEARMGEIMEKAVEEGRSTDEAEREAFDDLQSEIETIDGDLKRFKALEKINLAKAQPVKAQTKDEGTAARTNGAAPGYVRVMAPDLPKGIRFARLVRCIGIAKGNLDTAARIAEAQYGDDQPIVSILKAAVQAGTTTDATWAGPLVSAEGGVFTDFLEYLRPMTILGKFGTGNIPDLRRVPFRTPLGSQTSGGAGYWVGEAQAKPLTRFDYARTTLSPLKAANICVVSEELLRYAALAAETHLRDQLAAALAVRIDTDFIDPGKTAVSGISPASITNGVALNTSTGNSVDAVRADVAALYDIFLAANNSLSRGVWIMSAATALRLSMMYTITGQPDFPGISVNGGTFAGYPVITSEYVISPGSPTSRYVWLVDAGAIWYADEGGIAVDMSREASLAMDNAPTMTASEAGSPSAPVGASLVSLWQTNTVGFRAERTLNWAKARPEAVQGLIQTWGT